MTIHPEKYQQITALAWNRYITRYLAVVPSLIGRQHSFTYADCDIQITLPEAELEEVVSRELFADVEDSRVQLLGWRDESGKKIPVSLGIESVDVTIELLHKIEVHEEMLKRPPNAYDVLNNQQVSRFNSLGSDYRALADEVFEFWLGVLRWQSRNGAIGRPLIRDYHSGWRTYLLDKASMKRVWSGPHSLTLPMLDPISVEEWERAADSLLRGEHSPLYFDFYFDGIEHRKVGEFQRSVVDFAVSSDVLMRSKVMGKLPKGLLPPIEEYVDDANIRVVMTKLLPWLLSDKGKGEFKRFSSQLHQLFNARNDILHSGHLPSLTEEQVEAFRAATKSLISLGDDPANWA